MAVLGMRGQSARTLSVIVLMMQGPNTHCSGPYEYVREDFILPTCPDTSFVLPSSVAFGPYDMSASKPFTFGKMCRGFALYRLREHADIRFEPLVNLRRGTSCTLEIAYGYDRGTTPPEQMSQLAELTAALLLQGSGDATRSPADSVQRFRSGREFRDRCSLSVE